VDAFAHTMEQYMTYPAAAPLQDRLAEAVLATLIEYGPKALAHPHDYEVRATLMWTATMALNGVIGVGVPQDWSTHAIGHEITALYGLDHAQTLAIVMPNLWRVLFDAKKAKLAQYAERVLGVTDGDEDHKATAAIEKTEEFFRSMGVPVRFADYGITAGWEEVPQRLGGQKLALGERQAVTAAVVESTLELAAR
jgi:NADP-dependent alcohol dehydrogenase